MKGQIIMAVFTAQLSAQITQQMKRGIEEIREVDGQNGRCTEADVLRASVELGVPLLEAMSTADRLSLYSRIRSGVETKSY